MPRDEKGRFTKEEKGFTLPLSSPLSVIKYLIICLLLYPWYKLLGLIIDYCWDKLNMKFVFNKIICNCPK